MVESKAKNLASINLYKYYKGEHNVKKWLDARMKERTTWDGAALIILGLMVLFLASIAKDCLLVLLLHTEHGLYGKRDNRTNR